MDYERANRWSRELIRGCIILGGMFFLGAMYMIWFGGAV